MTDPSKAVFLSYASQDAEAAGHICEALQAAGIEVWFDRSELRGGDAWDQKIRREIRDSALFIPVISTNTQARTEGYFRLEWRLADQRTHLMGKSRAFLVPVCIDDTRDVDADVPDSFAAVQWTRLPGGYTPPAFVGRVQHLLAGEPLPLQTGTPADAASVSAMATPAKPVRRSKAALLAAVAVVAVALGYLVENRLLLSKGFAEIKAPPASTVQSTPAIAFNPPPHSIAVLPFANMSGDAKQDYFSDGITEELLNSLARLNKLQVVARTSSFSFKGQNVDVSTIAHKLNVSAILEGSVRRSGNTVRITAQLINAVTGFHIWSQTYDRNIADILKVQTEVATAVAKQLEVQLVANEVARIELGGTNNAQAYDAYLRGAQLLEGDPDESVLRAALSEFERAISLDSEYAAAYAQRARTLDYISIFVARPTDRPELRRQARDAAERAVALSPEFGEAHLELAQVRAYGLLDFRGALPEFDRALALAPGSARVQRAFAGFASMLGHFERAAIAAGHAIRLDPRNIDSSSELAQVHYDARQYGEALVSFQRAKALSPRSKYLEGWRINSLIASGQIEQASQDCEALSTPLDEEARHYCLALVYHALGRQGDGERELKKLKVKYEDQGAYTYATIYAQWGNKAEALRWLAKAEKLLDPGLQSLRVNWMLDPIRNEPEFKAIEARMNFPP